MLSGSGSGGLLIGSNRVLVPLDILSYFTGDRMSGLRTGSPVEDGGPCRLSQPALQIQLGGNRPLQLRPTRGNMLGKSIFRTVQFNQIAQLKPWVTFM
jgi:hypothetical protein